jgi:hypothetical protein
LGQDERAKQNGIWRWRGLVEPDSSASFWDEAADQQAGLETGQGIERADRDGAVLLDIAVRGGGGVRVGRRARAAGQPRHEAGRRAKEVWMLLMVAGWLPRAGRS